jgi:hypothetical protein
VEDAPQVEDAPAPATRGLLRAVPNRVWAFNAQKR